MGDPWGCRGILHDLNLVQEGLSLANKRLTTSHRLWEAHAAHAWAFPSDVSLSSLREYDKNGEIAACAGAMAFTGKPVGAGRPRLSAPQALRQAWADYKAFMLEFDGIGPSIASKPGLCKPIAHRITVVEAHSIDHKEPLEIVVPGDMGRIQVKVDDLEPCHGYFVSVTSFTTEGESAP